MVKIGDVCPLFFDPIKDKFGIESDYIQTFYTSDNILIQVFTDENIPPFVELENVSKGSRISLTLKTYQHNDTVLMYHYTLNGLSDSIYVLHVNGRSSEPFCVTSDETILETTSLVKYSHKDNTSVFDNIFWIGEEQQVFEWRLEAGFKSSGFSARLDNEQYRNQFQEITELYAMPYESYTLTIGNACGVPYWFIRHFNRILCLSSVEIEGNRWIRSEGSVPEISQVLEDVPSFNATILLEPTSNDVSGTGGISEAGSSPSVVGFSINNPTDGQMLQYSEDESAFVNVTTVES